MQYILQDNIERQRKENAKAIPQVALSAQNKTQKGRFFTEGSGLTNTTEIKNPSDWSEDLEDNVNNRFDLFILYPDATFGFNTTSFSGESTVTVNSDSRINFKGLGRPDKTVTFNLVSAASPRNILGFENAHLLTSLEDVGTTKALMFSNNAISEQSLESLYSQLPPTTKTATINVSGNPASATADSTIATNKGYTVVTA